jgi:hypothetical protein
MLRIFLSNVVRRVSEWFAPEETTASHKRRVWEDGR